MLSESAAPPGWSILREVRGEKSWVLVVMYSYIFSIKVGAQWTHCTGWPMSERAFQAENIEDEDGGQESGGKDNIWPFGRLESATEIPAM